MSVLVYQLDPTGWTSILEALGKVLSNQWWAAILLGLFIIVHHLRDAAVERRMGKVLEAQAKASLASAGADKDQAVAMQSLVDRLHALEKSVDNLDCNGGEVE